MSRESYVDGVLRGRWDDESRTYTEWDETGAVVVSRPYTQAENDRADAEAEAAAAAALADARIVRDAAILDAIEATATPPTDGAWVRPTGAHDAYPTGATVTHNGKTWINLTPFNVWEPGVSGWREEVAVGYPEWVRPTGGHDAYGVGDRVTFEGQNYESVIAANVWSPTEYPAGWTVIT